MSDVIVNIPVPGGTLAVDETTLIAAVQKALNINVNFDNALFSTALAASIASGVFTAAVTNVPPPPVIVTTTLKSKVIAFLVSIRGKQWVIGQTEEIWDKPLDSVTVADSPILSLTALTGKLPGVAAIIEDYGTNSWAVTPANSLSVAQTLAGQGMWLHVSPYLNIPTAAAGGAPPQSTPIAAADFHAITVAGSPQNKNWLAQCDTYIAWLKTLPAGAVIFFRPFIEANGPWNWFGGEAGADQKALFILTRQYFDAQGAPDMLWVWNINQNVGHYMDSWPGTQYADVASIDFYGTAAELDTAGAGYIKSSGYADLQALNVPLIASEIGLVDQNPVAQAYDNLTYLQISKDFPAFVMMIPFNGNFSIGNQKNAKALMTDPRVITLDELPKF